MTAGGPSNSWFLWIRTRYPLLRVFFEDIFPIETAIVTDTLPVATKGLMDVEEGDNERCKTSSGSRK